MGDVAEPRLGDGVTDFTGPPVRLPGPFLSYGMPFGPPSRVTSRNRRKTTSDDEMMGVVRP